MAYTESQKTALQEAIASGVLQVTYDGKTIRYRDMEELKAALAEVKRELAAAASAPIQRTVKIYAAKGL